jgi:hypothetical protein
MPNFVAERIRWARRMRVATPCSVCGNTPAAYALATAPALVLACEPCWKHALVSTSGCECLWSPLYGRIWCRPCMAAEIASTPAGARIARIDNNDTQ